MRAVLGRSVLLAAALLVAARTVAADAAEGRTMLVEAIQSGDIAQLRAAIDAGADLETRDGQGRTPLLLAVHADAAEAAKLLIQAGADVNARDAVKDTPFLYAGAEGRNEILKAILASGRANLKDTNRYGGTALIPAAHHGHPETVHILLGTDIDIDHVNDLGWTALLEAVILGDGGPVHRQIVGLLVDAGAKNTPDRGGRTPLDHARAMGFREMADRIAAGPRR